MTAHARGAPAKVMTSVLTVAMLAGRSALAAPGRCSRRSAARPVFVIVAAGMTVFALYFASVALRYAGAGAVRRRGLVPTPAALPCGAACRVRVTLPYERGALLPDTAADVAKLRAAWRIVARRQRDGTLYDFTGLERSLELGDVEPGMLDDDLAPALVGDRLTELALEHMGGIEGRDDVFVANRLTAAVAAAMLVLEPWRHGTRRLRELLASRRPSRRPPGGGGASSAHVGAAGFAAHLERLEPALVVLTEARRLVRGAPGRRAAAIGEAAERHGGLLRRRPVAARVDPPSSTSRGRSSCAPWPRDRARQVRHDGAEAGPPWRGGPSWWTGFARGRSSSGSRRGRCSTPPSCTLSSSTIPRASARSSGGDRGGDELESRLPWVDRTPVAVKLQGEDTARAADRALPTRRPPRSRCCSCATTGS